MSYLVIYRGLLTRDLKLWLQYRVAMGLWMVGKVIPPVINMVVWVTVARERGAIAGYAVQDFVAYFIVLMLVDFVTYSWSVWEFDYTVRTGAISQRLLQPIHPMHHEITDNVMYKLIGLPILSLVAVFLAFIFKPDFPAGWATVGFGVISTLLAWYLRFMAVFCLALLAFWTNRVGAFARAYFTIQFFLSGQFLPLGALPPFFQTLANWLHFKWMIWFPVEVWLGRVPSSQILTGILTQLIWCILSYLLMKAIWSRALKKYAAYGS